MLILTYKRTHTGDPGKNGVFGVHDCMGQIRDYNFDAVIGVGGISSEPRRYGLDRKINWVGINAKKNRHAEGATTITFEHFVLFENSGPFLHSIAPNLARRMYETGVRVLLHSYTKEEMAEAVGIINWARETQTATRNTSMSEHQQSNNGCSIRGCGAKNPRKHC